MYIYLQDDAKSKQKEKTKSKNKRKQDMIGKGLRDVKIKETRLGSYEELYITMVLRILLGQSLKMSIIIIIINGI